MTRDEAIERARGTMAGLSRKMYDVHGVVGTRGLRRNMEQNYALAYKTLVRWGVEPQLRGKYR